MINDKTHLMQNKMSKKEAAAHKQPEKDWWSPSSKRAQRRSMNKKARLEAKRKEVAIRVARKKRKALTKTETDIWEPGAAPRPLS